MRSFSDRPVPRELISRAIDTAGTAPSGAHRQPWHFVAVSDSDVKCQIRVAAEKEEYESYHGRMPPEWIRALEPMGTVWQKPYLETVPWLVVCFAETYGLDTDGSKRKNYYVQESCGIACGLLIMAIQNMGLATLTHTPSPMRFLSKILGRDPNQKPYMLFPVGYPAPDTTVPDLKRKKPEEFVTWI